jgi:membrane protein DedA with SNARE-associated domain
MTASSASDLGLALRGLSPVGQAVAFGLATFVQEDVPTVSAALLAAAGKLPWTTGFLGCFLGIWIGDLLLYLAARGWGRRALTLKWVQRFVSAEAVTRSESWFAHQGVWLLITSRVIPGTRLPTYLAAGFLRLPFGRFALITGLAVSVWTLGLFGLARVFGTALAEALQRWNRSAWWLLVAAMVVLGLLRFLPRWLSPEGRQRFRASLGRCRRWEFWPATLFYLPVAFRYLQLAVRHRGFTVPTMANPGITTGGLVGESKFGTLRELSRTGPEFTAEAWLLAAEPGDRRPALRRLVANHAIVYPFVLKPDLGQRGLGVKLIRSEADTADYLRDCAVPLVVQRYVPGPFEVGIFYYRFPHEDRGRIFALTEKIFPVLTGDGVHSIEQLVWRDERARFVADRYLTRFASRRQEVLPTGATLRLVEAGNHAQGCIFRDGARLSSPELEAQIDAISRRLPGFFIGRYDVRFSSEDDLRAGRNFQILELNGASAEATSIYDARNSLRSAYRTLFRQWELVFAIGAANRALGAEPTPLPELLRVWRAASRQFATYPPAD